MEVFLLSGWNCLVQALVCLVRGLVCLVPHIVCLVRGCFRLVEPFSGKSTPYIKASDHQSGCFFRVDMDLSCSGPGLSRSSSGLSRNLNSLSRSWLLSSRRTVFWKNRPAIKKLLTTKTAVFDSRLEFVTLTP